jgi:hypothetical protein
MATAEYMKGYRAGKLADERERRPKRVRKDPTRRRNPKGLEAHRKATANRRVSKCMRGCTCCGGYRYHVDHSYQRQRCLGCGNLNPPRPRKQKGLVDG